MRNLIFRIIIRAFILSLIGCSSSATKKVNPYKFDLIRTGVVKKANVLKFDTCLIDGFEVRKRLIYNVRTKQQVRTDGYRVESYGGGVILLLSADILNSGKTQLLREKSSSLVDLSKQISTFNTCLTKYK